MDIEPDTIISISDDKKVDLDRSAYLSLLAPFLFLLLFSLALFSRYYPTADENALEVTTGIVLPCLVCALAISSWKERRRLLDWMLGQLREHTRQTDGLPRVRIGWWIALAAGLGLYNELMIIRVHSSFSQLFAYFKNISLLSCFLGIGIGYSRAGRPYLLTPLIWPALAVQVLVLHGLRFLDVNFFLNPVSERLAMGMEQAGTWSHFAGVYGILAFFFLFNALAFVPVGQITARLMGRLDSLVAYGWNLAGSLAGIVLFGFLSWAWTPPSVWLSVGVLLTAIFVRRQACALMLTLVPGLVLLAALSVTPSTVNHTIYSPYQQIELCPDSEDMLKINISHYYFQRLLRFDVSMFKPGTIAYASSLHYMTPYFFKKKPGRVLVVGAGTGNDVAMALKCRAGEVDAVEIDPAILHIGFLLHPERPYLAPNVNIFVDDARSFIRSRAGMYDLVVYALLDSHQMLSGKSGVRLDSFVYTVEAFREIRSHLKKGGVLCLTFSLVSKEIGRKLYVMLREAFDGLAPRVFRTRYDRGCAFVIGNDLQQAGAGIPGQLMEITSSFADNAGLRADKSTDDWPFFYMPLKCFPFTYVIMLILLLLLSVFYVMLLSPGARSGFSPTCFFLGAGFMLLETKAITELALVFGGTWFVVTAVVAAILVMAFLANLFVLRRAPLSPVFNYSLLLVSIAAGLFLSPSDLGSLGLWSVRLVMTIVLTLPLLFSGMAFSTELKERTSVSVGLSSNILGAMLGGFLEYNVMAYGLRSLYFIALFLYAAAFAGIMHYKRAES